MTIPFPSMLGSQFFVRPQNPSGRRSQSKRNAGAFRLWLAVSAFVNSCVGARAIAPGARRFFGQSARPVAIPAPVQAGVGLLGLPSHSFHAGARRCEVRRQSSCSILSFGAAFTDAQCSPSRFGCLLRSAACRGSHLRPNPALNRTGRHMTSTCRASARPAG